MIGDKFDLQEKPEVYLVISKTTQRLTEVAEVLIWRDWEANVHTKVSTRLLCALRTYSLIPDARYQAESRCVVSPYCLAPHSTTLTTQTPKNPDPGPVYYPLPLILSSGVQD